MSQVRSAVLLAAGHATRAQPLSSFLPKCLFPFFGGTVIDYTLEMVTANGLAPHVVVGIHHDQVIRHLVERWPRATFSIVEERSPNLFDSLVAARKFVDGHFLWLGAAVIFFDADAIGRLVRAHEGSGAFCTLFYQAFFRYRLKLLFERGALSGLVTTEAKTRYSAPTAFVVAPEFFEIAAREPEEGVFQTALARGLRFQAVPLTSENVGIHTLSDYFAAHRIVGPESYVCPKSFSERSYLRRTYLYESNVLSSRLSDCIIIESDLRNMQMTRRIVIPGWSVPMSGSELGPE